MREDWRYRKLEEVCNILDRMRKPISKKNRIPGDIPYYGATGILDYVSGYIFNEKLVLLGEDGAKWSSGERSAFIIENKSWVNNHAHVLKSNRNLIIDEWLVYNLNFQDLMPYVSGMTVPKLNQKYLRKINIPIPPLPEQKRIVSILDKAFAAIDQAQANIERNIANAEELFQSKLNDIFFPKNEDWISIILKDITIKIGSGATPRGGKRNYKKSGISLIRSMNVYDRGFEKQNLAFIDEKQAEKLNNVEIKKEDVLLNITGASVARCCIVPDDIMPARVNQHVSIIRLKENTMNVRFLHYALISKPYKDRLLGIGEQGATRQAITKAQIQDFMVSYPSEIEKQQKIIDTIDEYKVLSNRITETYKAKIESLKELKKSLLQKAFSGELTAKEEITA